MTRVLHVLDHSLPLHSGYTFRTRAILKAQAAAGLQVRGITGQRHTIEAGEGPSEEEADGLTFDRTPGLAAGPAGLREAREIAALDNAIRGLAQRWRPDIIHAHSPALCGAATLKTARALGLPLAYEIRAFWEDAAVGNRTGREGSIKYRLTRALETWIVKGADAVFTICNGLRDDLIARGVSPAKIGVMPNGVDLELFGAPPPRDAALDETLGLAPGAPVIGYIGSFYDYEGAGDLIAAMPLLRASHPEARLLLVGAGVMEAEWRAAAARLPESEAVIFTGRVPHTEVDRYYSLVDVLAYPRKAQRLTDLVTPLKPLEAMAQQKLVAASDVGGHRELISRGKTGYLFPADDPAACAACLNGVLNERENWAAMKQRAADHVRSRHDWAVNVRNYLPVYHLLLAHASPSGTSDPQPAKAGISPR